MREHTVSRDGGRQLIVREDGDPQGRAIFSLHGTPGSRLLYGPHVADARRRGIRLIGYDRPGYGGSTAVRGRRIVDAAHDIAAIADALGIEKFGVWGHSGGGPHALACAAALPDRAVAAACLASPAPADADGLDPFDGLGEANAEDLRLLQSDPAAWEAKGEAEAKMMREATQEQLLAMLDSLLSEVDRKVLTRELGDFLQAQMVLGLEPGAAGMRDDNLAEGKFPWGFELGSIRVPVQLWHGRHDKMAPFQNGRWLAEHLPRAETHLEPDEGHISLYVNRIPDVHAWIRSKF